MPGASMKNSVVATGGGGGQSSLASSLIFRILVVLLVLALSLQFQLVSWRHDTDATDGDSASTLRAFLLRARSAAANARAVAGGGSAGRLPSSSSSSSLSLSGEGPAHLYPRLPHLPPFATLPNHDELASDTMSGSPTIAGVHAVLDKFLRELHASNRKIASDAESGALSGPNALRDRVLKSFTDLATKHLLSFDDVYRGRPLFPIREDDSIFISLASFRDHLLGNTLKEAFGQAANPDRLFVGAVVQNCFGVEYTCKTGAQVVGKDKKGKDVTKVSDAPPDSNGVEEFCEDSEFKKYCDAGQVRALYVNETESLGPAMARYYASKLWGGETFFVQVDAHLKFAKHWDAKYIAEIRAAKSYPKAVLSSYPPGFDGFTEEGTPGARLCWCEFSQSDVEDSIIRINTGARYHREVERPKQIAFIAAGFFFARAEFLTDVPFDPFLPWCFMGEEIALSMRAWTNGWDMYAPRLNLIAHQYRPGRMGLPKFWGSVGRSFGRPGPGFSNRLQNILINRIKHMVGYPDITRRSIEEEGHGVILADLEYYGLGTTRTREDYLRLTEINFGTLRCGTMHWCNNGELD